MHLAVGMVLALVYAAIFDRVLPGPRWVRGAAFSLLPWLFAITLMAPGMEWLQATVEPAEARMFVSPGASGRPANPCSVKAAPPAANPCAIGPKAEARSVRTHRAKFVPGNIPLPDGVNGTIAKNL